MFDTLKRLYDAGRLPKANLKKAVAAPLEWLTPEQYKEITGDDYTV